jgi:hypothetical protein
MHTDSKANEAHRLRREKKQAGFFLQTMQRHSFRRQAELN